MGGGPSRSVLGAGTYGVVVERALSNVNERGKKIKFPGYVSKIFISELEFNDAKRAAQQIEERVPSLRLEFTPYRRRYSVRNLKNAPVIEQIRLIYNRRQAEERRRGVHIPSFSDATRLFVARMPNLGFSFRHIADNFDLQAQFQALAPSALCLEIRKVLQIVKDIKDAGYAHCDIRETNIMLNLETGTITIIDFDWFKPRSEVYANYPQYFYSHPPEMMFLREKDRPDWLDYPRPSALIRLESRIKYYFNKQKHYMFWLDDLAKEREFRNRVMEAMTRLYDEIAAGDPTVFNTVRDTIAFPKLDEYGLGLSLRYLFEDYVDTPLKTFVVGRLFEMLTHPNLYTRSTVEQAITEFEAMVTREYPGVALAAAGGAEEEAIRLGALGVVMAPPGAPSADAARALDMALGIGGHTIARRRAVVPQLAAITEALPEGSEAVSGGEAPPPGGGVRGKTRRYRKNQRER